jgi:creatinine amidohydrolase
MKYRLWEMSWREAMEAFERSDTAIVPVGSIHHHGINIIGDDSVIAQKLADEVGEKTGLLILPLLPYGDAEYHKDYPCINIKQETLTEVYKQICKSLHKFGIRKVIFINGHGGNSVSLRNAGLSLRDDQNWLKHTLAFYTKDGPRLDYLPVTITRWPPAARAY